MIQIGSVMHFRECENTLYPPHGQNQNHGLVFGSVSLFPPVSKENVALVLGKSGFSFWFQFLPKRRGWGIVASFEYYPLPRGVHTFSKVSR